MTLLLSLKNYVPAGMDRWAYHVLLTGNTVNFNPVLHNPVVYDSKEEVF